MRLMRAWPVSLLLVLALAGSAMARSSSKTASVSGYVLDSACAFTKDLEKLVSPACAVACAKAGSVLVILADDGTIYWPISSAMPAKSQNGRLMRFAGKRVTVSGRVYEKGGSHAIVMEKIEETEKSR